MAWKTHDGTSELDLKPRQKVKTMLTPFKCAIGEMVEDDDDISYKKTWEVFDVFGGIIILKSGDQRMVTDMKGYAKGDWIHHKIYKVKI